MNSTPTPISADPMTPVRALIAAAGKITPTSPIAVTALGFATMDATASISQLLSEHDKVVAYIAELREHMGMVPSENVADSLAAIVEGK